MTDVKWTMRNRCYIESNRPGTIRSFSGCILGHDCVCRTILLAGPAILVGGESLWPRSLPSDTNHGANGPAHQESVWRPIYALRLDTASDGRVDSGHGVVRLEHARSTWQHHRRDRTECDVGQIGLRRDGR